MVKLGDVCEIARGGSPRPIDRFITNDTNGINWIKIGDTDINSKYITQTKQKIKIEGLKKSRYVKVGDFLLTNSMSFGHPYILKIDGCIHDGWLVLTDKDKFFDSIFLYFLLSSNSMYTQFKSLAVGGVVNNLNSEMVRKVTIPLPPLEEQKRIADELDKISTLIAKRKSQIEKLDLLVKAKFVEMFGDPVTNPMGWEVSNLGDLAETKIGPFGSLLHKEDYVVGQHALVNPSHIIDGIIVTNSDLTISQQKYEELQSYHLQKGDVVLGRRGEMGRCAIVSVDGLICGTGSIIIRPLITVKAYFLYKIISYPTFKQAIEDMSVGVTMMNLNIPIVSSFKIPVPPLELQNQFADYVQKVEQTKTKMEQGLAQLEVLYKQRMQEYFKL